MSPPSSSNTAPSLARAARRFLTYPPNSASPPLPSRGTMPPWRSLVPTIEMMIGADDGSGAGSASGRADFAGPQAMRPASRRLRATGLNTRKQCYDTRGPAAEVVVHDSGEPLVPGHGQSL